MNRLGIYFFYDKQGIADDYVFYYLENLKPFLSELCVVVNGFLTNESKEKFNKICDKLIVRQNIGYDSCAYKEAMESYGYDKLKEYDELLLCNFTCFGPVYPFKEMFDKMDNKECDFWGITRYPERKDIVITKNKKGIPEHVMSYFLIIRNSILKDESFKNYWDNLQVATNYAEAVAFNELIFTNYFESRGFKSEVFMSRKSIDDFCENTATFNPIALLKERCPLVKRKAFFAPYVLNLKFGNGFEAKNALNYIETNTDYDTNLIWKNLIRTTKGSQLKRCLHLNHFLDEENFYGNEEELKKNKTALLLYSYYDDMAEYAYSYAKNLPEWVDIFILVVSEKTKLAFEEEFSKLPNKVNIEIKENRGQLASAVMISGKHIFENYDLVCVVQTKKTSQLQDKVSGEIFCNHCWNGVLKSPAYVLNVIKTFNDNPYLGYSCSIPPHWEGFKCLIGNECKKNKADMIKTLKEKYGLSEDYYDEEPIASYGECYWVRAKAYKTLLSYPWKHEDFPEAKNTPKDGCILNALERLNSILIRHSGYYPAWIMPTSVAVTYFDNIYYLNREKNMYLRNLISYNKYILIVNSFKKNIYRALKTVTFGKLHKKMKEKYNKYKSFAIK